MVDMVLSYDTNMTEILFKDSSAGWPTMESVDQNSHFGGFCIGCFFEDTEKSGTGFVVKLIMILPKQIFAL
jgi:hypothetical protein